MNKISLTIICGILGTVAIPYGAVHAWVWPFFVCLSVMAYLTQLWSRQRPAQRGCNRFALVLLGLFLAWTALQWIPLPESVIAFLSAAKYQNTQISHNLVNFHSNTFYLAYSTQDAFAHWILLISFVLFYRTTYFHLQQRQVLRPFLIVLMILCVVESTLGLVQVLIPETKVLWSEVTAYQGRARGTYINRNHFAGFLEMTLPLIAVIALQPNVLWKHRWDNPNKENHNNHKRFFIFLILALMSLVLLFSGSRAGIVSASAGMTCFFFLSRLRSQKTPLAIRLLASGSAVLILLYGTIIGFKQITERFLQVGNISSRIDIWHTGFNILQAHPHGIGLANTVYVAPLYGSVMKHERVVIDHLHNDYLQLMVETGWIGAGLLLLSLGIFIFNAGRKLVLRRKEMTTQRYLLGAAALSGIISIAIHSFIDFNLQIPANCFYLLLLFAILSVSSTSQKPSRYKQPRK